MSETTPNGDAVTADQVAPVSSKDRIESLDFIRGIAVMGILAANIVAFGQPFGAYMYPAAWIGPTGDPDGWMWVAQFVLIDGKMRGLFTLLFGAGLYLFMERTWARGGTRWRQALRLFFLLLFGLIHFYFIWRGDILSLYAVIGLVMLPLLRLATKTQLVLGAIGYLIGILFYLGAMGLPGFVADLPADGNPELVEMQDGLNAAKAQGLAADQVISEMKQNDSYLVLVEHRLTQQWSDPFVMWGLFLLETMPFMLIGVALYRMRFFSGGFATRTLKLWGWTGLALGGVITLSIALWVQANGFTYWGTLSAFMGLTPLPRLFMVLGLASILVAYSPAWTGWLAERVRAAGRVAFTNYLGTSIIMLFVFHGWALGLFGKLNRPELYLVMVLTWALMLAWSKPWLDRYRYGPLEWLWRCLTYRTLFTLKR